MTGHTIRLRGAWEWRDPASGVSRRVALPLSLPPEGVPGVLLIRPFNRPPVDPATESIWLQLQRVPGLRSIRLNGEEIARPQVGESEHAVPLDQVQPARNVLVLELGTLARQEPAGDDPAWGEVALVIKSAPT